MKPPSTTFSEVPPLAGRYKLREPLGEGSFAITYLADDLVLGRRVAVKVLRTRYGADPTAAARFQREARAAAAVSSPYLVDVFDFGVDQGASFIVLEYIAGPTLRDHVDRSGRLDPREAVRIAGNVLRGLDVIHRAGIVHRDVKPQNVLLDRHGVARVTDFGVAIWAGAETLTSQGMAVGTAAYMAPEQARGAEVGVEADLYAVGVMLFEMLTGRQPFVADNPAALLLAHVQQEPPLPTEVSSGLALPVAVEREVMRALAKEPGDRRASALAMATALETAAGGLGAETTGSAFAPGQVATTASIPAVTVAPALVTRADQRVVGAAAGGVGRTRWLRLPWLGPLALILAAVVVLVAVASQGGFSGLAEVLDPPEQEQAIVPGASSTPPPTWTPSPGPTEAESAPTISAAATGQPLFPIGQETPAPTNPTDPTQSAPAVAPTGAPTEAPTSAPELEATEPADSEPEVDERATRRAEREQERETTEPPLLGDGSAIPFAAGDWQGAGPPSSDELSRPAVALYGSDGPFARASLQFELPEQPAGPMVLTITGLGDETGIDFPYGFDVNGMYVGESNRPFAHWNPAQDGLNGENAAWDQVRLVLPPEVFRAGQNEIAIISLFPGGHDDRPPYLLLSDATLAPE